MRKILLTCLPALLAAFLVSQIASAGPGIGISLDTNSLTGTGSNGNKLGMRRDCVGSSKVLEWNGTAWACVAHDSTADISAVTAGNGLTGGGTTGAVNLDIGCSTGLSCGADTVTLNMAGGTCSAGNVASALSATGTLTCTAIGTQGGTTGTGTNGTLTKWTGATSLGNSIVTESGSAISVAGSFSTTGNATFGDAATDEVYAPGYLGVGVAPLSNVSIRSTLSPTAGTSNSYGTIQYLTGTRNTTAAALEAQAGRFIVDATRSVGANDLYGQAVYAAASGGQFNYGGQFQSSGAATINYGIYVNSAGATTNYGIYQDGGSNVFNGSSGSSQFYGSLTIGDAAGDVLSVLATATFTPLVTATGGGTTPANWTTTGTGDLVSADDLTVTDDATINGDTTLGDATTDTTTINGATSITETIGAGGIGLAAYTLLLTDNTTQAVGVGAGITFAGAYTGTTTTSAATIKAYKTNGTAGNFDFDLVFGGRANGAGDTAEAFRVVGATAGVTVTGPFVTKGTTSLGDAEADTITFNGDVASNVSFKGSTPSISCGAGASVTGNNTVGVITLGDAGAAACGSCRITFASPGFTTNAPICTLTPRGTTAHTIAPRVCADATTTLDVTGDAAKPVAYHCFGRH